MESNSMTYDLLKSIHSELKIAVQNHQFLILRRKMCPTDPDIENHINVTQGLIVSLGRSQAELLSQFRKESGFSELKYRLQTSPNFIPKGVPNAYVLKHLNLPLLKVNPVNRINNLDRNKKIGVLRYARKDNVIHMQKGIQQSLLKLKGEKTSLPKKDLLEYKIIDGTKIKLIYSSGNSKKNEGENTPTNLKSTKKQMSVLKSKNDKDSRESLSNSDENLEKLSINDKCDNQSDINHSQIKSEPSSSISPSSTNEDIKLSKTSLSRSSSISDESELNDSQEKVVPKLVKKYDTRFLRKKKYTALLMAEMKKSSPDLDSNKLDGDSSGNEGNEIKPLLPEDIGQELFLGYFGLVSKAKGDVLKRKRCERKRRSVAGQSSLYSDYYQPVSSKRTYAKKPTSSPTSPTNQVIVETAVEVDDEDEKPKYCMVCNETGAMEVCESCSGCYHEKCKPNPSNGCPNCSPQPTDINSIVGANFFASPSSYEIIKRYSVTNNESIETNNEDEKDKEPKSVGITQDADVVSTG